MRRPSAALLVPGLSATLLALPAVTPPASAARPVAPVVSARPLSGVDATGLRESVAPDDAADGPARRPVAVTGRLATGRFAAVGVTWARGSGDDVTVQVRTRSGGRWSGWSEVEVEANAVPDAGTPEAGTGREGSDPLWSGDADGVQVRVDAAGGGPRDLRLVLVDPGASAADATAATGSRPLGGAVAEAAEPRPTIVSRAAWGADESLRNCTPSVATGLRGAILHTTATGNDYAAAESPAIMRSIYAYHTSSLGWCDIGYNFLVDRYGTVFEGRYGGVDRAVIGAHTGGFNTGTVGVSMIGNQDLVAPTSATLTSVEKVFAWKLGLYGLSATGTTTYTSGGGSATVYPAGTVVTKPTISGHRDYSTKSCPGNYAYPLLPSVRTATAARMGTTTTTTKAATSLTLAVTPVRVAYGSATTLAGRLTATTGAALGGRTVQIYARVPGTTAWNLLSTRTTAADGTYSGTHVPTRNLDYSAVFPATSTLASSSRTAGVQVAPVVTGAFSATTTRVGSTVLLRGTVKPLLAGQAVQRQQRLADGTWTTLATGTISATGTYSFSVVPAYAGTKAYRVIVPATGEHVTGATPVLTLTVL